MQRFGESKILEAIPTPEEVAERLGEVVREATILKKMLKISKEASREREWRVRSAGESR